MNDKDSVVVRAVDKTHVFVASKNTRIAIIPILQVNMNSMMKWTRKTKDGAAGYRHNE